MTLSQRQLKSVLPWYNTIKRDYTLEREGRTSLVVVGNKR
jgi:hypothetical protein